MSEYEESPYRSSRGRARDRYIVGKLPPASSFLGGNAIEILTELTKEQVDEIVDYGTLGSEMSDSREPHGRLVSGRSPECVSVAYDFIQYCNRHSVSVEIEESGDQFNKSQAKREIRRELMPKQEAAFNLACEVMGTYFADSMQGQELLEDMAGEE